MTEHQDAFARYLSQPCDFCDHTATHNQDGHKVCNQHLDRDRPCRARDD